MNVRIVSARLVGLLLVGLLPWHVSVGGGFDDLHGGTAGEVVGDQLLPPPEELSSHGPSEGVVDGEVSPEPIAADGSGDLVGMLPIAAGNPGPQKALFLPVRPRWQAQVDALMLWQGNIPSRVLYTDAVSGDPALDINQAQTEMAAGARYGLILNLDPVYAIEGNYFNVSSFAGSAATPPGTYGQNNLAAPSLGPADGILFTSASVLTSGTISSAELNWRRRTCSPITWLAGFRWVEWNQGMAVQDRFVFDPAVLPPGSSDLDVATGNNLYGGQVGMDLCLWNRPTSAVQVNALGKAGVFYNHASYQRTEGAFMQDGLPPTQLGPAAATADQTSFVGELGVNASLRITSWLSWRAGYTLFWLSGVATPAEQLSVTNVAVSPATATIDTNGSVLLHGVTTGLEARW
jgi:hypothetical protein